MRKDVTDNDKWEIPTCINGITLPNEGGLVEKLPVNALL